MQSILLSINISYFLTKQSVSQSNKPNFQQITPKFFFSEIPNPFMRLWLYQSKIYFALLHQAEGIASQKDVKATKNSSIHQAIMKILVGEEVVVNGTRTQPTALFKRAWNAIGKLCKHSALQGVQIKLHHQNTCWMREHALKVQNIFCMKS